MARSTIEADPRVEKGMEISVADGGLVVKPYIETQSDLDRKGLEISSKLQGDPGGNFVSWCRLIRGGTCLHTCWDDCLDLNRAFPYVRSTLVELRHNGKTVSIVTAIWGVIWVYGSRGTENRLKA